MNKNNINFSQIQTGCINIIYIYVNNIRSLKNK